MSNNTTVAYPYENCVVVSDACPVSATTLGYYPNVGINYFFAICFGLATFAQLITGIWKRTYGYSFFLAAGAALELAGYAGRIPLHANPWNTQAFETQICTIILAPTLICIGLYLTLQHMCLALNPQLSRIRPTLYPWLFVPGDVSCLLVQAAGGALAAGAGYDNDKLLAAGNHAIIAGIALQVVVLVLFGVAGLDYYLRVRRWIQGRDPRREPPSPAVLALWADKHFRLFGRAVAAAYVFILIRCIYRIAEMAGGWGNVIMQDEPSFIVLEGFMIFFGLFFLTAFPPGFLFPQMALSRKQRRAAALAAAEECDAPATADDTEGEKGKATEATGLGGLEAGSSNAPSDEAMREK